MSTDAEKRNKQVKSFRLSRRSIGFISDFARRYGASEADIVEMAIDNLAQQRIGDLMNPLADKVNKAHERIDGMEFSEKEQGFIFADWPNWEEHLDWLLTASREEISSWIVSGA